VPGKPTGAAYALPSPGDIVWCRFPEDTRLKPAPKPRPVLILAVGVHEDDERLPMVRIAAGTSRKVTAGKLYPWELLVESDGSSAFQASGLSYTTKFNIRNTLELPYTSTFFEPPPLRPYGATPKLGSLHASYMAALRAAFSKAG
jgi:hypothetical protein